MPGTVVKVVKGDGTLAKELEAGELYVKGGQVALGYYGNEKAYVNLLPFQCILTY